MLNALTSGLKKRKDVQFVMLNPSDDEKYDVSINGLSSKFSCQEKFQRGPYYRDKQCKADTVTDMYSSAKLKPMQKAQG